MKLYTNNEQTAKLIELGLPKPRYYSADKYFLTQVGFEVTNYSIGELIKMLPSALSPNNDEDREFHLMLFDDSLYWHIRYTDGDNFCYRSLAIELIDALYDMVIVLKKEDVL